MYKDSEVKVRTENICSILVLSSNEPVPHVHNHNVWPGQNHSPESQEELFSPKCLFQE